MRITGRIPKAISKNLEYVTLIIFPQQHWLPERDSILRYTYIAYPVNTRFRTLEMLATASMW